MNGFRRILGGGSQTPPRTTTTPPPVVSPLAVASKPSWPPDRSTSSETIPKTGTTAGLVLRKQKATPVSPTSDDRPSSNPSSPAFPLRKLTMSSPVAGPSSPHAPPMFNSSLPVSPNDQLNMRDELLVSLLTSEAVVDSRECEILSAEEIEELKKEQQLLSSRLGAMTKKLNLETKIRDAAMSLSRVNASHKRVSKQTEEQLESANRRVESAQRELWRVSERCNDVQKKLLEHRAGVLGFSVRNLENKMASSPRLNGTNESGYSTPNRSARMSPTTSSVTSVSTTSKARFDGAHMFAGHVDAVVPRTPKGPLSTSEVAVLEEKLKTAQQAMDDTAKKQAEMARELSLLRLEKEQVETTMGMELQSAEETIMSLEKELPRLEDLNAQLEELKREKKAWERERETLEGRLEVLEEKSGDATQLKQLLADAREKSQAEMQEVRAQWEADKAQWEEDKAESLRYREELEGGKTALRLLAANHAIPVMSGNVSLSGIVESIEMHLMEVASQLQTPGGGLRDLTDISTVTSILQPIWVMLPSPELRAEKLSGGRPVHQNRSGSQSQSQMSPTGSSNATSLSDMDVRSLKTLYDTRTNAPSSPNAASFSIEAFAGRVQALIADDRNLIERLLRFAQAHDLLKKNAERAQKLAMESNNALETYQKQVKTLEERNTGISAKHAAVQGEIQTLQEAVDRITAEKREVEKEAASLTESYRQLTQANNTLSARALTLAEEAATAPEKVRTELMAQLTECQAKLKEAQEEVDAMRRSDQSQTEALLDELNSLQTDNGNLRAQLRAVRR